jgi:hypothetical protein
VTIALEPALDNLPELLREDFVVEQMVYAQTGAGRFARVSGADALLCGSDAAWRSRMLAMMKWRDRNNVCTSFRRVQLPSVHQQSGESRIRAEPDLKQRVAQCNPTLPDPHQQPEPQSS